MSSVATTLPPLPALELNLGQVAAGVSVLDEVMRRDFQPVSHDRITSAN